MLVSYNSKQRLLIVKNESGKIVKAFGGKIAREIWLKTVDSWLQISKN